MMSKTSRQLVCFTVLCVAFACAFTQIFGVSRDYPNYEEFFSQLATTSGSGTDTRFEPGFTLAAQIAASLTSSASLIYALIATLSLYLKFDSTLSRAKLGTASLGVLLLLYMVRFFPLHELTQLRIALALGILVYGVSLLHRNEKVKGILFVVMSVAFHYSLIAVVPFVFLGLTTERKAVLKRVLLIYLSISVITGTLLIVFSGYFDVLAAYEANNEIGDLDTNPLSAFVLLDFFTTVYMFMVWKDLDKSGKHFAAVQALGLAVFFATISLGVIAIRTREAFSIFYFLGFLRLIQSKGLSSIPLLLTCANVVLYGYTYFFYEANPFFS